MRKELQKKGALNFILSNPHAQTKSPRPRFPGPHPGPFEYLHNSLSKLCQSSVTLTIKQCFPVFRENLLRNSLCLLSLPCHWQLLKGTWLHPLGTLPFRYLQIFKSSLLTTPSSGLNHPRSLRLSWDALNHHCGPSLDSLH